MTTVSWQLFAIGWTTKCSVFNEIFKFSLKLLLHRKSIVRQNRICTFMRSECLVYVCLPSVRPSIHIYLLTFVLNLINICLDYLPSDSSHIDWNCHVNTCCYSFGYLRPVLTNLSLEFRTEMLKICRSPPFQIKFFQILDQILFMRFGMSLKLSLGIMFI